MFAVADTWPLMFYLQYASNNNVSFLVSFVAEDCREARDTKTGGGTDRVNRPACKVSDSSSFVPETILSSLFRNHRTCVWRETSRQVVAN